MMELRVNIPQIRKFLNQIIQAPGKVFDPLRVDIRETMSRFLSELMESEISFFLGCDLARALADPLRFVRRFVDRHLRDAGPQRRADVMMALAFRHAVGIEDAKMFFQHWDQVQWARR